MNLAEALAATPPKRCKFRTWVESLPDEDQATVATALADPNYSSRHLWRVFTDYGLDSGDHIVWKHRTGQCKTCA